MSRGWVRNTIVIAAVMAASACGGAGGGEAGSTPGVVTRPTNVRATPEHPTRFGLGRPASAAEVAAWDRDANATGVGLPEGRGTHAEGAAIYAAKCATCHGAQGEGLRVGGTAYPRLIGREPREGFPFAQDLKHVKTIGNYWPYATTVYDYIQGAMPLTAPGSLTPNEVYGLTAYLLAENEVIPRTAVMDARTLPQVRMPARDRFVLDDRTSGAAFK